MKNKKSPLTVLSIIEKSFIPSVVTLVLFVFTGVCFLFSSDAFAKNKIQEFFEITGTFRFLLIVTGIYVLVFFLQHLYLSKFHRLMSKNAKCVYSRLLSEFLLERSGQIIEDRSSVIEIINEFHQPSSNYSHFYCEIERFESAVFNSVFEQDIERVVTMRLSHVSDLNNNPTPRLRGQNILFRTGERKDLYFRKRGILQALVDSRDPFRSINGCYENNTRAVMKSISNIILKFSEKEYNQHWLHFLADVDEKSKEEIKLLLHKVFIFQGLHFDQIVELINSEHATA